MNKEAVKKSIIDVDIKNSVLYQEATEEERDKIIQSSELTIDRVFVKFFNHVLEQRDSFKEDAETVRAEIETISLILNKYS